jgi:hypothetical protein
MLNLEFFSDELPEKKLQLVDMSILSILLSPRPGCHSTNHKLCTNLGTSEITNNVSDDVGQQGSTSWYSKLSAEKREEYLQKQSIARQQKNATAQNFSKQNREHNLTLPPSLHEQISNHTLHFLNALNA